LVAVARCRFLGGEGCGSLNALPPSFAPMPRSPLSSGSGRAAPAPLVVALIGLPGAGKSCIAAALESRLGLHRICRDRIRAAMFPQCSFSPAEKRAAMRAALTALEVNCALGRSSVLDGMTLARLADRLAIDRVVAAHGVQVLPLHVDCPPALARERVAKDAGTHPARDRDPALVDAVLSRFAPVAAGCTVIDARLPVEAMCNLAVELVRAQWQGPLHPPSAT
jgi:predicted kinase